MTKLPNIDTRIDEEKLILMTSTFDVISENPLHDADFGEGRILHVLVAAILGLTVLG
jgi:hypothetical protein